MATNTPQVLLPGQMTPVVVRGGPRTQGYAKRRYSSPPPQELEAVAREAETERKRVHPWLLENRSERKELRCPLVTDALISELEERMTSELSDEADPSLRFSFSVFLWELVSHMLQPLILPVTLAVDGRVGATNKYLWASWKKTDGGRFIAPVVLQAFPFILAAALSSVWYFELEELYVDVILALVLYFYRNCVIATKYAFYPEEAYDELHKTPDADLSRYLVASWSSPDAALMEAEVLAAQQKTKIDLRKQSFYLQHPNSVCFVDGVMTPPASPCTPGVAVEMPTHQPAGTDTQEANRVYLVPVHDVFRRMVGYMLTSSRPFNTRITRVGQIGSLLVLVAVWWPFSGSYSAFTAAHWATKSVLSVLILFLWATVFIFLMAGVIHYHRLGSLMTILLWSVGFTSAPGGVFVHNKISFQIPENIYAWFHCREVALDLGYRFQARITAYVSIALALLLCVDLVVLAAYVWGYTFYPRVVLVVVFLTIFVAASLAAVILCAARANLLQVKHSALLALEKLQIRNLMLQYRKGTELSDHMEAVARALGEAKRGMDGLYDAKPVSVFGVRASFEMLTKFATAFATASAFGVRILIASLDS